MRFAIPATIILLAYYKVAGFGWAWDDYSLFIDSPLLRQNSLTWAALAQPILPGTTYFRPLVLFTYALEFRIFGLNPGIAHIINVTIFLINCYILFALSSYLYRKLNLNTVHARSLAATFLYGLHPTLTESVAWNAGRFDLLCTMFTLMALSVGLKSKGHFIKSSLAAILFIMALLCKEMAVVLPFVFFTLSMALTSSRGGICLAKAVKITLEENKIFLLACAAAFASYVFIRVSNMHHLYHVDPYQMEELDTIGARIVLVLRTISFYAQITVLPFTSLSPMHPFDFDAMLEVPSIFICLATAASIAAILLMAGQNRPAGWLMLTPLISLGPVSQIIPLTIAGSIGADRFLTLPLAFFFIFLCSSPLMQLKNFRPAAQITSIAILLSGWLILAFGCLYVTVPLWKNDLTLWKWTYDSHPDSIFARDNYLSSAMRAGRYDLAKPIFDGAIQQAPLLAWSQIIYGNFLIQTGNAAEGIKYLKGALSIYPQPDLHPDQELDATRWGQVFYGYSSLANGYLILKDFEQALKCANRALWYRPTAPYAKLFESFAYYGLKQTDEGDRTFSEALQELPQNVRNDVQIKKTEFLRGIGQQTDSSTSHD